ncbi:hypothetical protein AgCh_004498 [Apium graveolens]
MNIDFNDDQYLQRSDRKSSVGPISAGICSPGPTSNLVMKGGYRSVTVAISFCNICGKKTAGGVFRAKEHKIGGRRNAKGCQHAPSDVRKEIKEYMEDKKPTKEDRKIPFNILVEGDEDLDLDLEEIEILNKSIKKVSSTLTSKQQTKGPLDIFLKSHHGKMVQKRKGHTKLDQYIVVKKEIKVNYDSFDIAIQAIRHYGSGMKTSTYHEVGVPLLKQEMDITRRMMAEHGKNGRKRMILKKIKMMNENWELDLTHKS